MPVTPFAVGMLDVAIPDAFVTAVVVLLPPNDALAPVTGAVNVTVTLATGFDDASVTRACSAVPKVVLIAVLCGVPAVAVIVCAAPAVFVNANVAGVNAPTVAVTL